MLPQKILNKYLARFDELISEGESIQKTIKVDPYDSTKKNIDRDAFMKWEINCESLLDPVIPSNSIHRKIIENPPANTKSAIARPHIILDRFYAVDCVHSLIAGL